MGRTARRGRDRAAAAAAALTLAAALVGCAADEASPGLDPEQVHDHAGQALDETLPVLEEALDEPLASGTLEYAVCGLGPGTALQVRAAGQFHDVARPPALALVAAALEDDGWVVERPSPTRLDATRDGLELRVVLGETVQRFDLESACFDAGDAYDRLQERPDVDLAS